MRLVFTLLICWLTYHLGICQIISPVDVQNWRSQSLRAYGINPDDLAEFEILDQHVSKLSGVTHVYIRQRYEDIPVLNGIINLTVQNGQIINVGDRTIKNIQNQNFNKGSIISSQRALRAGLRNLNIATNRLPSIIGSRNNRQGIGAKVTYNKGVVSRNDITAELFWMASEGKEVNLVWTLLIEPPEGNDFWHICIDAETGLFLQKNSLNISCQFDGHQLHPEFSNHDRPPIGRTVKSKSGAMDSVYHIFDIPFESPNHGGRSMASRPWERAGLGNPAITLGWHKDDSTIYQNTRGNNVYAYEDTSNTGSGYSPEDLQINFNFPLDFNLSPEDNMDAAITNLFFWNNTVHDILYQYGFDEPAGNFQKNNMGRGGVGGDYVKAEALDGSGTNNANFLITPDGVPGRMQMYLWSPQNIPPYGLITPDGSFDNGIIVHEYVHGVSTRLTGGPQSFGCLINNEQMGEGWSDYFALMLTTDWSTAQPDDPRGIGTYVLGEDTEGTGIRAYPYTTDMNENPMTYDYLKLNFTSPHWIGSVWATMLWDMTWKIIELEGIDTDIYFGQGGNNIAMQLVLEGLKLQPCAPGFVDGRNAILEADKLLYNGKYQCLIWEAFARRGLGVSADQGAYYFASDGMEAFDTPESIQIIQTSPMVTINELEETTIQYQAICQCGDQSEVDLQIITSKGLMPLPDTNYTIHGDTIQFNTTDILCGDTTYYEISVGVECLTSFDSTVVLIDSIEGVDQLQPQLILGDTANWETQNILYHSANTAWYAENVDYTNESALELKDSLYIQGRTFLSFYHQYETEFFWDGGFVQYRFEGDTFWYDAEDLFIKNGYQVGRGFTGNSVEDFGPGFQQSVVDFSKFTGETIRIRFLFDCDVLIGGTGINGWYIDDVKIIAASGVGTQGIVQSNTDTSHYYFDYFPTAKDPFSWYVDTLPNIMQDGYSWETAFKNLQEALQFANCGDTIHVAEGIYFPTSDDNRDSTFCLVSGITIMGGYPSGGGSGMIRDPLQYITRLSGNIGNPDSISDNSYQLIRLDSSQKRIVLDGLMLTDANANGTGETGLGGAIYNEGELGLRNVQVFEIQGNQPGYVILNLGPEAILTIQDSQLTFEIVPGKNALLNKNQAKLYFKGVVEVNE